MNDKKGQKGISLIEVVLTSAITALVVGGLAAAVFTIVNVTQRGNDETSALHDVQNATHWLTRDARMAGTTDLVEGAPAADSATLQWIDSYGGSHSSSYSLAGTELQRDYDGSVATVARHVSSLELSISGNILTFYIESVPPGRWQVSRETTGRVCLRPQT